jgi:DNA polymerase-3 subunit delta'
LSRSFVNNRIASTYLFHGPEGCGRWALAISFAALLNCEEIQDSEDFPAAPCGRCGNCRKIYGLNFEGLYFALPLPPHKNLEMAAELTIDILEAKRKEPFSIISSAQSTNIPIETAREIRRSLSLRSGHGITRVAIFYEMEKMRTASADALLKLIEEPPPKTVLVLISRRPEALLPTIQSRSQKIRISRVPKEVTEEYLQKTYDLSENRGRLLSRICDYSPGRSIELIDSEEGESTERGVGFLLFKSLFDDAPHQTISHINEMLDLRNRGGVDSMLSLWQSLLRDCLNYSVIGNENNLINTDFTRDILRLSGRIQRSEAAAGMADDIKNTLEDLRRNSHIQGALTALTLKLKSHISASAN